MSLKSVHNCWHILPPKSQTSMTENTHLRSNNSREKNDKDHLCSAEKDLVMGMIKQALDGFEASSQQQHLQQLQALHHPASSPHGPPLGQSWRKPWRTRSGWTWAYRICTTVCLQMYWHVSTSSARTTCLDLPAMTSQVTKLCSAILILIHFSPSCVMLADYFHAGDFPISLQVPSEVACARDFYKWS